MNTETILNLLIDAAKESDCLKRRFGALAVLNGNVIGIDSNKKLLTYHRHLCTSECIRTNIPSRVDSMIGACGHAEEKLIWRLANLAKNYDLYVLQIDQEDKVIYKNSLEFSCVRCATAMHYGNVRGVWLLMHQGFKFIPTSLAIETAYDYALGKKKAEY